MNGPERLKHGSGFSKKLLESAAFDQPSAAARRRAVLYASTAGGLSMTHRGESTERRSSSATSLGKTLVTWIAIGAAASAALAFGASRLSGTARTDGGLKAAAELPTLPSKPSDIAPEHAAAQPTLAATPPGPLPTTDTKVLPSASAAPSAASSALPIQVNRPQKAAGTKLR